MSETYSSKIVKRLKATMSVCPTCGKGHRGLREVAKDIGISTATLHRVMNAYNFDVRTLDKIEGYLGGSNDK